MEDVACKVDSTKTTTLNVEYYYMYIAFVVSH